MSKEARKNTDHMATVQNEGYLKKTIENITNHAQITPFVLFSKEDNWMDTLRAYWLSARAV